MKAAGYLVSPAAEFSACMENGKDYLHGRDAGLFLDVHGNSAAVVGDGDGIVGVDLDVDGITEARQGLVHGIVYNFIYKMMKSPGRGASNVHARPLSYGLKPL